MLSPCGSSSITCHTHSLTRLLPQSDIPVVDNVFKLLPVSHHQRIAAGATIKQNVIQVFVVSFGIMFTHGLATWLVFTIANMQFAYSAAFITGVMTIFPLLSPWLVYAPALLISYLQGDAYVIYYAIALYASQWLVESYVDDWIYELVPGSSPYLTGLAIAVGVGTFGVPGLLIGPMLFVLAKTVYQLMVIHLEEDQTEMLRLAIGEEDGAAAAAV